jgi:hypothetical protein
LRNTVFLPTSLLDALYLFPRPNQVRTTGNDENSPGVPLKRALSVRSRLLTSVLGANFGAFHPESSQTWTFSISCISGRMSAC